MARAVVWSNYERVQGGKIAPALQVLVEREGRAPGWLLVSTGIYYTASLSIPVLRIPWESVHSILQ